MFKILPITLATLTFAAAALGSAHTTATVGEGDEQYRIIAGYSTEPAYTEERNGLDLFVRTMDDEPIANLENSLRAELVAPTGERLPLELRGVHGEAGNYTDDFVLTRTGVYELHVSGFVGSVEVDVVFELHEVASLDDLRFP